MRGFKSEAFSGTVIEAVHSEGDLVRGNGIKAHLLREELTNQSVHVLVRATFPGGIVQIRIQRMSEEEVCVEFFGDTLMLGKLLAVVGRQCVNTGCERRQQGDHGVRNGLRGLEWHMRDQGVAGCAR